MRKLLAALSFLVLSGVAGCNQPNDTASIEAVDNVVAELDEAYQTQDADAIKVFSDLARDHTVLQASISTTQKLLNDNPTDLFYR